MFRVCIGMMVCSCPAGLGARAAEQPPAALRPRLVDPAIQPAGGASCKACGAAGCRHHQGRPAGHHGGCRDGVCVPYCPVRPQQFGFYGTQWRRWPGQQIQPVSAEQDATPIAPPRSAVPGPGEESMNPPGEDQAGAGDTTAVPSAASPPARQPLPDPADRPPSPPEPGRLEPAPVRPAEPRPDPQSKPPRRAPAEPAAESPAAPQEPARPAAEPAQPAPETKPRPEDENLFEVLSGWRARRTFPVGKAGGGDAPTSEAGGDSSRPVGHAEPEAMRTVPRVSFDPAAETRRLRSAR